MGRFGAIAPPRRRNALTLKRFAMFALSEGKKSPLQLIEFQRLRKKWCIFLVVSKIGCILHLQMRTKAPTRGAKIHLNP